MTRRGVLAFMASAAALPSIGGPALAQEAGNALVPGPLRFRSIAVDTATLAQRGAPATADLVERVMARQMREVFGDLLAPREAAGATLVARMSSLYLTSYAGSHDYGGRNSSGGGNDSLEGVGIVSAGGRILSETPILSVLDPGYSGAWYLPDIDRLRVESICHHFAWWLRREMGV